MWIADIVYSLTIAISPISLATHTKRQRAAGLSQTATLAGVVRLALPVESPPALHTTPGTAQSPHSVTVAARTLFSGVWHRGCISDADSSAREPTHAIAQDGSATGIGIDSAVGVGVPGPELMASPQESEAMFNDAKLPKAPAPGTLDDLLNRIVDAIQLTAEQHNRAARLYTEIGRWLAAPGTLLAPYAPEIFPQGSMLLRTTVRPMSIEGEDIEFDLDLVGRHRIDPNVTHAGKLYAMVKQRLEENPDYKERLEAKGRCLRLNYPDDLFHLDVIPACADPADAQGVAILIPDKDKWTQQQTARSSYKESDPLRYADWFEQNTEVRQRLVEKSGSASVAPVPPREPASLKAPLRKIVQLIKRGRDLDFIGDAEIPSSILITTMASRAYRGEENLAEGLENVLRGMNSAIKSASPGRVVVANPTNPQEDFARAPSQACYDKFAKLIEKMCVWISKARKAPPGRRNIEPVLEELMGKSPV
ncbi:MAG TPA: nucleotidyltransferase, partial [Phycisphaerales bacterium]